MDNSLIELGNAAELGKVVDAADMIGAKEIVLGDHYMDRAKTIKMIAHDLDRFESEFAEHTGVNKFMVVPQGETAEEWMSCYDQIMTRWGHKIHSIGIPKNAHQFTSRSSFSGRVELCQNLEAFGDVSPNHEYHLLGCWQNPIEIRELRNCSWIRGIDTCLPTLYGRLGISFDWAIGSLIPRPKIDMDFHVPFLDDNPLITEHNIMCMLRWAQA